MSIKAKSKMGMPIFEVVNKQGKTVFESAFKADCEQFIFSLIMKYR